MDKVKAIMEAIWSHLVKELFFEVDNIKYHKQFSTRGLLTILERFDWSILTEQLGEEPAPPEDTPEQKLRRMFQDVEYNPDPVFVLFRNQITKRKIEEWWEHLSDGNKTEERDCFVGEVFDWLDKDGE